MSYRNFEMRTEEKDDYLFNRIRNDLDPYGFTVEEIMEEGLDAVLYPFGSLDPELNEAQRKNRVFRTLRRLINRGLIVKDTEFDNLLVVTEVGMDT